MPKSVYCPDIAVHSRVIALGPDTGQSRDSTSLAVAVSPAVVAHRQLHRQPSHHQREESDGQRSLAPCDTETSQLLFEFRAGIQPGAPSRSSFSNQEGEESGEEGWRREGKQPDPVRLPEKIGRS